MYGEIWLYCSSCRSVLPKVPTTRLAVTEVNGRLLLHRRLGRVGGHGRARVGVADTGHADQHQAAEAGGQDAGHLPPGPVPPPAALDLAPAGAAAAAAATHPAAAATAAVARVAAAAAIAALGGAVPAIAGPVTGTVARGPRGRPVPARGRAREVLGRIIHATPAGAAAVVAAAHTPADRAVLPRAAVTAGRRRRWPVRPADVSAAHSSSLLAERMAARRYRRSYTVPRDVSRRRHVCWIASSRRNVPSGALSYWLVLARRPRRARGSPVPRT